MRHWGCRQGRGVSNGTGWGSISNRQVGSHGASALVPPPAGRLCWEEAGGSTQSPTLRPGSSGLKQVALRRRCPLKPPAQVSPDPATWGAGRQEDEEGSWEAQDVDSVTIPRRGSCLPGPARDHLIPSGPPAPGLRGGWAGLDQMED